MWGLLARGMTSTNKEDYEDELSFMFREFIDLKFVLDPEHEFNVLGRLLFNLGAHTVSSFGQYCVAMWNRSFPVEPFDVTVKPGASFREFADSLEHYMRSWSGSGANNIEMLHLVICYGLVKGYNPEQFLESYVNKLLKEREDGDHS